MEMSEGKIKKTLKGQKAKFNPKRAENKTVTQRGRSGNSEQGFPY